MEVYGDLSWPKICKAISNRVDAVRLAYLQGDDKPAESEGQSLQVLHKPTVLPLLRKIKFCLRGCPKLYAKRQDIFGSPTPPLKVLTTPEMILALAK